MKVDRSEILHLNPLCFIFAHTAFLLCEAERPGYTNHEIIVGKANASLPLAHWVH